MTKREPESHNIEWKQSWRDEYLKWLCGYANVRGGKLFIGVNDDGFVIGVEDVKQLLQELPNKIKSKLGIIGLVLYHNAPRRGTNIQYGTDGTPESNKIIPQNVFEKKKNKYALGEFMPRNEREQKQLEKWQLEEPVYQNQDGSLDYIEIVIEPYPHLVSYNGVVYKRSGSDLQTLDGIELQEFVMERSGIKWDEIIIPKVGLSDLSSNAIKLFKEKAVRNGRRTRNQVNIPNDLFLEDIKAYDSEKQLFRASVLMFHPDPEKYITGTAIKIGFFGDENGELGNSVGDVVYHDIIRGPFIEQVDKATEIIYSKYMKALISYDGNQRIENYFWPREAFREILLNAMINKDYSSGNPIQIKVYDDYLTVFNEGHWPVNKLLVKDVYKKHSSYSLNRKLGDLFFESGEVESWGGGFDKIKEECEKVGAPLPVIEIGEGDTPDKGVIIRCNASEKYLLLKKGIGKREGQGNKVQDSSVERMMMILSEDNAKDLLGSAAPIIDYLKENDSITVKKGMELMGKSKYTVLRIFNKLIEIDVIEKSGNARGTIYLRK